MYFIVIIQGHQKSYPVMVGVCNMEPPFCPPPAGEVASLLKRFHSTPLCILSCLVPQQFIYGIFRILLLFYKTAKWSHLKENTCSRQSMWLYIFPWLAWPVISFTKEILCKGFSKREPILLSSVNPSKNFLRLWVGCSILGLNTRVWSLGKISPSLTRPIPIGGHKRFWK